MKVKREKFRTMLCYLVPENVIYAIYSHNHNISETLSGNSRNLSHIIPSVILRVLSSKVATGHLKPIH